MSDSHSPAQPPIHWFNDPTDVPADVADWLMEMGSMTRRFEKQGVTVTVKPQNECFVSRAELGESEAQQLAHIPDEKGQIGHHTSLRA